MLLPLKHCHLFLFFALQTSKFVSISNLLIGYYLGLSYSQFWEIRVYTFSPLCSGAWHQMSSLFAVAQLWFLSRGVVRFPTRYYCKGDPITCVYVLGKAYFMAEVMRGYLYDGVFKIKCSSVSRKALPVFQITCKSLCVSETWIPSKAESGILSLFWIQTSKFFLNVANSFCTVSWNWVFKKLFFTCLDVLIVYIHGYKGSAAWCHSELPQSEVWALCLGSGCREAWAWGELWIMDAFEHCLMQRRC